MVIAVIDGQGAGIGKSIIKRILEDIHDDIHIIALATNEFAMINMLKAGAHHGIMGDEAIVRFCRSNPIDAIIGPIGVICIGGIQGEITPAIAEAVFRLDCEKYLIPLQKHGIYIPGTRNLRIKDIIDEIVKSLKEKC